MAAPGGKKDKEVRSEIDAQHSNEWKTCVKRKDTKIEKMKVTEKEIRGRRGEIRCSGKMT